MPFETKAQSSSIKYVLDLLSLLAPWRDKGISWTDSRSFQITQSHSSHSQSIQNGRINQRGDPAIQDRRCKFIGPSAQSSITNHPPAAHCQVPSGQRFHLNLQIEPLRRQVHLYHSRWLQQARRPDSVLFGEANLLRQPIRSKGRRAGRQHPQRH